MTDTGEGAAALVADESTLRGDINMASVKLLACTNTHYGFSNALHLAIQHLAFMQAFPCNAQVQGLTWRAVCRQKLILLYVHLAFIRQL